MTCYNCGYKTSVVSKDDIGWLCEWCSDNELRSPIIKRLKKRIEDRPITFQFFEDNDKFYDELQKILGEEK